MEKLWEQIPSEYQPLVKYGLIGLATIIIIATNLWQYIFIILVLPLAVALVLKFIGGDWGELGGVILNLYKVGLLAGKRQIQKPGEEWNYLEKSFENMLGYRPDLKVEELRKEHPEFRKPEQLLEWLNERERHTAQGLTILGRQEVFSGQPKFFPLSLTNDRRLRHVYITGMSGTGKTTLLSHIIRQDLEHRRYFLLISPRRDFIEQHVMPWAAELDPIPLLYFDPTSPKPMPWNPLHRIDFYADDGETVIAREDIGAKVDYLISMFQEVIPPPSANLGWTPRMEEVLLYTLKACVALDWTFLDIFPLLDINQKDHRQRVIDEMSEPGVREFFTRYPSNYHKVYIDSVAALFVRLSRLLSHKGVRKMFCPTNSKASISPAYYLGVSNPQSMIVNASPMLGMENARMVGRLFISAIQQAISYREKYPEREREQRYIHVDESQEFLDRSYRMMGSLLDASRQYGFGWTFVTPPLRSENKQLEEALLTNCGSLIALKTTGDHAKRLASNLYPRKVVPLGEIRNMVLRAKHSAEYDDEPAARESEARLRELAEEADIDTTQSRDRWMKELENQGGVFLRSEVDPRDLVELAELSGYAKIGGGTKGGSWTIPFDTEPYLESPKNDWRDFYANYANIVYEKLEDPAPAPQVIIDGQTVEIETNEPFQEHKSIEVIYPPHV